MYYTLTSELDRNDVIMVVLNNWQQLLMHRRVTEANTFHTFKVCRWHILKQQASLTIQWLLFGAMCGTCVLRQLWVADSFTLLCIYNHLNLIIIGKFDYPSLMDKTRKHMYILHRLTCDDMVKVSIILPDRQQPWFVTGAGHHLSHQLTKQVRQSG